MLVRVTAGWDAAAIGPDSIRDVSNFAALGQVNVLDVASLIVVEPQISLSSDFDGNDWTDGGLRPEWSPFTPGNYLARRVRMRVKLGSLRAGITAELRAFTWAVDVPDMIQRGAVETVTTGAVFVPYLKMFHEKPGLVVSTVGGDPPSLPELIRITDETPFGFRVEVVTTGGSRVARALSWIAQGY
jgi:hypothetical protein